MDGTDHPEGGFCPLPFPAKRWCLLHESWTGRITQKADSVRYHSPRNAGTLLTECRRGRRKRGMEINMDKIGVIDVGGGLRSIYGAGVFDWCLDHGVKFDYCIGVSAGSANVGSYVSGQRGRNYRFYHEYAMRPEFVSLRNRRKTGEGCNVTYMYGTLANEGGEDPWDYDTAERSDAECVAVAMDARTGRPVYFTKDAFQRNHFFPFMASSNIPILNKPFMVGSMPCYDGGCVDPLPIRKAFRDGCTKVVVILTLPRDTLLDPRKDLFWSRVLARRWPKAAAQLKHRSQRYNSQVRLAEFCEAEGRALIVAPKSVYGLSTLTQDADKLDRLYHDGYRDAAAIEAFLA